MTEDKEEKLTEELETISLAKSEFLRARASTGSMFGNADNPWSEDYVDKYASKDIIKEYRDTVDMCRFFYRRDPIASTVINKLVDIGITGINFGQEGLTDNQLRVFNSLKDGLEEFLETCALEFLVSGLVIPEVVLSGYNKRQLNMLGIKGYSSLQLPASYFVRDSQTIVINDSLLGNLPTYYVEVPDETIYFINHKGIYSDGTEDKELYNQLLKLYPDFITKVREIDSRYVVKLDNPLAIRRKYLPDSPYPLPYLYPALEPLKHKRNFRRMDYAIASRVISAIQLVKLGNDTYPLTELDSEQLGALRDEMTWRNTQGTSVERIFQLFSNHTLDITWVYPPADVLLSDSKFANVNNDVFYALGFPRILVTGETERSSSSDAEMALLSPIKTMNNMRRKMLRIAKHVVESIAENNNFKSAPAVMFEPMDLGRLNSLMDGLRDLYETRNMSRETYAGKFGLNWDDEITKISEENKKIEELGVEAFAPKPHSNTPDKVSDESPTEEPENTQEENTEE